MSISSSVLKTLAYADIFDFPLTANEASNYLISNAEVSAETTEKQLKFLVNSKRICKKEEFYFLKGREKIVETRNGREKWSKEKWIIAEKIVNKLKSVPAVKMVGITGALAMNNCKEEDDIDLLIVTSKNSLWLTRLLLVLGAPFLGINRRKPNDLNINNKICFNLFLDEDHLKIEPESLFLAHEIAQIKVIYDKGGIYERFLEENKWVGQYLPNAINILNSKFSILNSKSNFLVFALDYLAFSLQLWYMKPKMTIEKVNLFQAFFHPKNLNDKIQKEFERRIKSLE